MGLELEQEGNEGRKKAGKGRGLRDGEGEGRRDAERGREESGGEGREEIEIKKEKSEKEKLMKWLKNREART